MRRKRKAATIPRSISGARRHPAATWRTGWENYNQWEADHSAAENAAHITNQNPKRKHASNRIRIGRRVEYAQPKITTITMSDNIHWEAAKDGGVAARGSQDEAQSTTPEAPAEVPATETPVETPAKGGHDPKDIGNDPSPETGNPAETPEEEAAPETEKPAEPASA